MSEQLKQAIDVLLQISEDRTVPRNIRESAEEAKKSLESEEEDDLTVKVDKALQILDEMSEDPNLPVYTRTQIWSVVTLLEALLHQ